MTTLASLLGERDDPIAEQMLSVLDRGEIPQPVTWAERQSFSQRISPAAPGLFSFSLTPYLKDFVSSFADPAVTDDTAVMASQVGKTTALMLGVGWSILHQPGPTLWVTPTEAFARSFSQTRWQPFVNDNPELANIKPTDKDLFKLLEQHFQSCTVNFVGSNSTSQLISRPIQLFIGDEIEEWQRATNDGTSALRQGEQRTKAVPGAKRIKCGTPKLIAGELWQDFLAGDQRHYQIPCPECHVPFIFEMKKNTLQWSHEAKDKTGVWNHAKVLETARYHCPACDFQIRDHHKPAMLRAGAMHRARPEAPAHRRSRHLNSFYSPWVSFGQMAVEFLRAQDLFGLQDFTNGYLGLPWEDQVAGVHDEKVLALRRDDFAFYFRDLGGGLSCWAATECPCDPVIVTLCADPGQTKTHWSVEARESDGTAWLLAYGTVLSIEDLLKIVPLLEWPIKGTERTARVQAGLVDSGDFTNRVYSMCARSKNVLFPSKGSTAQFGTWGQSETRDYPGLILYTYTDFSAKCALYLETIAQKLPPRLWWPSNAGHEFISGHMGQKMVQTRTARGYTKFWKPQPEDHFGDCSKLHRITWWILEHKLGCTPDPPPA